MLRLLVTLVLLAALLFAADLGVTAVAEQRTAAQASEVLRGDAVADLESWPVTLHLIRGRVPSVHIAARDVELAQGARLDRLDLTLEDVRIGWRDLQGPADRLPAAEVGRFSARLGEEAVQSLLGLPDQILGVELAEGHLVLSLAGLVEIEADVEAADGQLVVVPRTGVADLLGVTRIPIDLSAQPGQPAVESAEVSGGFLTITGMLRDVSG